MKTNAHGFDLNETWLCDKIAWDKVLEGWGSWGIAQEMLCTWFTIIFSILWIGLYDYSIFVHLRWMNEEICGSVRSYTLVVTVISCPDTSSCTCNNQSAAVTPQHKGLLGPELNTSICCKVFLQSSRLKKIFVVSSSLSVSLIPYTVKEIDFWSLRITVSFCMKLSHQNWSAGNYWNNLQIET